MTIKIRQTPYSRSGGANIGPYQVHPDDVRAHLIVIAMAGGSEMPTNFGESPDAAEPEFTVISYDPGPQDMTTPAGRVRAMLKELVDRPAVCKIFGMGPDFVWSDGTNLEGSAGAAIGDWIFYDTKNCNGNGRWVRGTDGNEVCTISAGILFHELGHRKLNHPSGLNPGDLDHDERAAVEIENDLRVAQMLVPRDPARWPESHCGCPDSGCCIVASVATESPYSAEVHALRRVRDELLRGTRFGQHLFDAMHHEYYSFSVGVCRIMLLDHAAKRHVESWLVRPLVRAFEIALSWSRQPDDLDALIGYLREDARQGFILGSGQELEWRHAAALLQSVAEGQPLAQPVVALGEGTVRIYDLLAEWLPRCPHVRWGIVDLLSIYATARARYRADDERAAGMWLRHALERWVAAIPLDYVLQELSPAELCADLQRMGDTVFTSAAARRMLGERLAQRVPIVPASALEMSLRELGYLP